MTIILARRGTLAKPASVLGAAPFNIAWAHAVWAGDPLWTPPTDGNPVDSMRNQSGGGDPASTGGNRPTYRAATAAYNNKPTVQFAGASSQRLDIDVADIAQPYSLVVVGNTAGGASGERIVGTGATSGGIGDSTTNFNASSAGTNITGGATDANPHLFRLYANTSPNAAFEIDGTVVVTGNAGSAAYQRLTLGASSNSTPAYNNYVTGHVAFVGVFSGDVTAAGGWADFKAWVASEYNLVIA